MRHIDRSELQRGDILLSRGDSAISQGIVDLDGGSYSHVALWDGREVVESTLPEARSATLSLCTEHALYVDAFRNRREHLDRDRLVEVARSYIGQPYATTDLALTTLLLAVSSWMPSDWLEMASLYGAGRLDRLLRVLLTVRAQQSQAGVTCAGLVVCAHQSVGAPLVIRIHGGRQLKGSSFLRALQELCRRLLEEQPPESDRSPLFESSPVGSGGFADDLRWVLSLPDPELVPTPEPRPRGEVAVQLQLGWLRALGLLDDAPSTSERVFALSSAALAKVELRAGEDWAPSLVTPRQLESSPDLVRIGRLFNRPRSG